MVGQTPPDSGMPQRAAPSGALVDVASDDAPRPHVLMITEGAYPYYLGGVGVWCDRMISDLPNLDFTVLGLVGDPQLHRQYELPSNVIAHHQVVLWGVRELLETRRKLSLAELRRRRSRTSEAAVRALFVPSFRSFLGELYAEEGNASRFSRAIHDMHRFFVAYDFDTAVRAQATWDCFVDTARERFPQAAKECGYDDATFTLADLTEFMSYLYRWLVPIATAPPRADVVHAVSDGLPGLAGMIAKLEYGMPFLLTEHGVYLRERYLVEADGTSSLFVKLLGLRFGRRVTELSYLLADLIAPASNFNQRWELQGGAPRERMRTIYNGVDPATFIPVATPPGAPPTVVWIGRITPIKDLVTLIHAAALVHEERPDIEFKLYGAAPPGDEEYYETCRALIVSLGIEDVVAFGGFASSAETAFNQGDLVALSSISECFPYSVVEAMLCARPLVATAVGGVPEAIEGCGIAVEPRNPPAMAAAILELMNDRDRRLAYGRAARERATLHFNLRQCAQAYEYGFRMLTETGPLPMADAPQQSVPLAEPGRATMLTGAAAGRGGDQAPLVDQGVRLAAIKGISVVPVATVDQALLWRVRNQTEPATGSSNGHAHGSFDGPSNGSNGTANGAGHLAAGTETRSSSEAGPDHEQVATLATQAAERLSQPVDKLEVAAVLESMGLTDKVAQDRYRTRDVFELAERVLARMRRTGLPVKARMPKPEPPESLRTVLMDYLRGPLSLGPILILLVIIAAYRELGHWGQGQVLAFSLGMTGSMLLTNCFIQAMARRGSIYLSRLNPRGARRFLGIVVLITAGVVLAIGLAWMAASNWTNLFEFEDRIIFAFAFTGLSAVWVMAGLLAIVQKPAWLGLGLGIGLPAGIAADLATAGLTPLNLAIGSVTGLLVALGIMLHPVARALSSPTGSPSQTRPKMPAPAYLLREAAPYFAYGGLYMVFILTPHLIGWTGALEPGQSRLGAGTGLELGLTLALGPIILVGGVAERAARLFWSHNRINQTLIHGSQAEAFGQSLFNFYRRHLTRYLLALLAVSVVAYAGYFAVQQWSPLGRGYENATYFFVLGIIGYLVLAWGLFNSLFAIALGRPVFALRALVVALLLTVAVGVPLSLSFSYMFAAVSFIVGAAAYGSVTFWDVLRLCRSADYYYFSSF